MDNIQDSLNKIKKMYENLGYFDQYGSQIFLFVILSVVVLLVYSYCSVMLKVQPIKDDWANQRCNPKVIPFAGFINKPPGKSVIDFTQENFTQCVQGILKSITGYAVQPITYTTNVLQNMYLVIANDIQGVRNMINNVRNSMQTISSEIMSRILNTTIPLQQIIIGMKDAMGKIQGVLTAGLFTSLGSYYALKSLLGAIVEFIVIILAVLLALILMLWIIPLTWPAAALNSSIFLAIAIPLTIIVVFLNQVLGIKSSAIPQLRCFDSDTKIELLNGNVVSISEICVGDTLKDESVVTGKMKVDAKNLDMYSINGILVSGNHYVKSIDTWIHVSEDRRSKKINSYAKKHVYCLNTSSKVIVIDGIIFSDWDDIFDEKLKEKKKYIAKTFDLDLADVTDKDIHKYLDGGFDSNTMIRLKDNTLKFITDVEIHDILENGECVYGIVEIDGMNVVEQMSCILGKHKHFVGGNKLNFFDKNLGQTSTLKICHENYYVLKKKSEKLYHLVTDKGTFKVWDILFNDYNSCIDLE
jgi:hypothetical protein